VVTVRRVRTAGADAVWAVPADGWRLPTWVVGGAGRRGGPDLAAVGARLVYGIGA
jgi:hypothetical protein